MIFVLPQHHISKLAGVKKCGDLISRAVKHKKRGSK